MNPVLVLQETRRLARVRGEYCRVWESSVISAPRASCSSSVWPDVDTHTRSIIRSGRDSSALNMRAVARTTSALARMPVRWPSHRYHLGQIGAADSGWVMDRVIQTVRHLAAWGKSPRNGTYLALRRTKVDRHAHLVPLWYSAPSVL